MPLVSILCKLGKPERCASTYHAIGGQLELGIIRPCNSFFCRYHRVKSR